MLVHGTTAWITGANRGIGRALVGALLQRGAAKIYATVRRPSTLDRVIALDRARVVPLPLGVTDVTQLGRAAEVALDVNMLTLVPLASMPGLGVYNASKAAAWWLTQSLRGDLSKRGVKVFVVFPGAVDTEMIKAVAMPKVSPNAIADEILAGIEADTDA